MTRTGRHLLLFAPAALLLGLFFIAPIGGFLVQGFLDRDGALTLDHVGRMWAAGTYVQVMVATVKISLWVTVFSVLVGYPVAYVLANADPRRKSTWALFVLLPFWSSFLVRTFAWIVIFGRQGPVNAGLVAAGLSDQPLDLLYGWAAVVIGMTNVLVPFAILTMVGVMERIDRGLMVAAGTLGARPVQAFFRIYLPLSMPGVTASALLVFITALGFFMAPALLGSARETMITQLVIQQVMELVNWPFAAILCLLLLATALVLFVLFDKAVGLSTLSGEAGRGTSAGSGIGRRICGALGDLAAWLAETLRLPPPRPGDGGAGTKALAILAILFLIVPLLLLLPVSLSAGVPVLAAGRHRSALVPGGIFLAGLARCSRSLFHRRSADHGALPCGGGAGRLGLPAAQGWRGERGLRRDDRAAAGAAHGDRGRAVLRLCAARSRRHRRRIGHRACGDRTALCLHRRHGRAQDL